MKGKIAFEEHFAIDDTLEQTYAFAGESGDWEGFKHQILDLGEGRLERMDANGIAFAILSLNTPGVQGILDTEEAVRVARKANDAMADAVARHPARYGAFAALPMQDPDQACAELTRCVRELGFSGAMLNGYTQRDVPDSAIYYDAPEYHGFWATVSELDVPIYLHPRMQLPSRAQNYRGQEWMMSAPWGFAVETSIHALRLCGSGIFEDYPNLKVILGHLGENIPFGLERMDERMRFSPRGYRGKQLPGEYFRKHFHLTVSGNFNDAPFRCALDVMGPDRLYFSADYPFEAMEDGASWFDATTVVAGQEKERIGRGNAIKLFGLDRLEAESPLPASSL
ncbi:MAG: amidohydrolase family protein [Sphingomonas sp.]